MIIYLILGLAWVWWFEKFTTRIDDSVEWTNKERILHIVAWPVLLATFIWKIFNTDNKDNE
tara:strand:+ start:32 stop:214 length:183 start_codon:yes stop_codon:yes gene_type:complete